MPIFMAITACFIKFITFFILSTTTIPFTAMLFAIYLFLNSIFFTFLDSNTILNFHPTPTPPNLLISTTRSQWLKTHSPSIHYTDHPYPHNIPHLAGRTDPANQATKLHITPNKQHSVTLTKTWILTNSTTLFNTLCKAQNIYVCMHLISIPCSLLFLVDLTFSVARSK